MDKIINYFNEFLCTFNEIVWPASTFLIWLVSIMYVYKKKDRRLEHALALLVVSVFVAYVTFCFFLRKPIGVSIPLSVGLICGILFYFDKKRLDNKMDDEKESLNTDPKEEASRKSKPGKSIDSRTIFDFVIGKDIPDKTAYIQQLKDLMEGRKGQKALEECILPELGTNISTDITFRAFDDAFPNVIDKAGFSRFKKKIPSKIKLLKL